MPGSTRVRPRRTPAGTALRVLRTALLLGCSPGPATAPTGSGTPAPGPTGAATTAPEPAGGPPGLLAASRPVRLAIPSIEVDTGLIDLGLRPDGTMEVPADGSTAGWYTESPTPGELGPAVVAAHVDWQGAEGVFYDLRRLGPGDEVVVERADGIAALFAVRRVEQYPKDRFPSQDVYGDVATPQLRLITCGGDFDDSARSYRDNIVVYAELTGSTAA